MTTQHVWVQTTMPNAREQEALSDVCQKRLQVVRLRRMFNSRNLLPQRVQTVCSPTCPRRLLTQFARLEWRITKHWDPVPQGLPIVLCWSLTRRTHSAPTLQGEGEQKKQVIVQKMKILQGQSLGQSLFFVCLFEEKW